jgi:Ser/Thr protein kinase RdoA (MazF antagonist)
MTEEILRHFRIRGEPVSAESVLAGHINRTYHVITDAGCEYTLQRISRVAFHHPEQLIANIAAVTEHLRRTAPPEEEVLQLVPADGGRYFYVDPEGEYWRVYRYLSGGVCLNLPRTPQDFYQCALAFGRFQERLSDFPADQLYETIPNFHNTIERFRAFRAVVARDKLGLADRARREIDFALEREEKAGGLIELLRRGELPLRVTHNDTKLNNVLLDEKTGRARAVLDLDTVMPGLAVQDFGDAVRFGASTAPEDERDLDKVTIDLDMFRTYTEGFLAACGRSLTPCEIDSLVMGAWSISLELGTRFLGDYLEGDAYFASHRPGQNFDRAAAQFRLAAEIERKWDELQAIVRETAAAMPS